jgi:hypothetical protein
MKKLLLTLFVIVVCLVGDSITRAITAATTTSPIQGSQLSNISTRCFVQTGDNVMIGGFMFQGTQPKRVIIRAIGSELTQYAVPNALADPILELHDGTGALIASNDNWQHTIIGGIITSDQVGDISNSGHAPWDPRESAIIADLPAGNYTAIVRGVNNTTGVALVEVYDLSPATNSILGNISTRAFVQTGDDVVIGGFVVKGTFPERVILRAIGPELTQYGIPNALADPTLELHDGSGALIASNDNWQTTIIGGVITSDQVKDIRNSGKAPGNASESAIIANLPPGNYTAIVRGKNIITGVALVEVYDINSMLTLDNGTIKVGVDTLYGGGITYLSQSGSTTNLINIYDFGREVQQSYYSGPANFVPPGAVQNPNWSPFPWNPIQVGDSFGYRAAVLAYSNSGGTIYVRTRPMQWALRNYPGDCIFEQWTHLDGPAVRVHCKLTNQRTDHTQYPAYGQELPAVYGVGSLCHIFSYTGTAPFTGGALTQLPNAPPPNWTSWRATENWSAMVNSSSFGFGVHNPDSVFTGGGYSSAGNPCTGGATDNNTGYIGPTHIEVLDYNIVYEYDFNLIVGTLTSIRNWAYTHRSDHRPDYHFGTTRQHWYPNYGDAGVPSGFLREHLNGPDPSLIGPNTAFAASACPRIYFAARYVMSSPPVDPHADLYWETNNSGGFSEARKQSVTVIPDGTWRVYSFDVGTNPAWSGLISQLRLDPIQSGGTGDYVDIAGISYQNSF